MSFPIRSTNTRVRQVIQYKYLIVTFLLNELFLINRQAKSCFYLHIIGIVLAAKKLNISNVS